METGVQERVFTHPDTALPKVWIVYGTHTGNSQMLARDAADRLREAGFQTAVCDMEDLAFEQFPEIRLMLIIVSTDGDGEVPLMGEDFFAFLKEKMTEKLNHLCYSVLALGDTSYDYFCKAGKDFDDLLAQRGADRLVERVDCDVDYEDGFASWIHKVLVALNEKSNKFILK